jgi:hypothetical protein
MRATPFALVFAELADARFPAIAERLSQGGVSSADRDHFVLLEPVGRLLREIVPDDAGADALEAHVRMLHHAYRHWAGGGWVYRVAEPALRRAIAESGAVTSHLPRKALYLQLPELQMWGTPTAGAAAEPLDGMFVSETARPGEIAVLGIFGMREGRPGFSAVGLEGRADADDAAADEIPIAAPFTSTLAGADRAGIHSVESAGELLLLTCRLLALLPATRDPGSEIRGAAERIVEVV